MLRNILAAVLVAISLIGCGSEQGEHSLPEAIFSTQWVKVRSDYYLLVSWSATKGSTNVFDYNSNMTAFRYGTSESSFDNTIYLYSLATKGDNQPTYDALVDPRRVCSKLSDLKVKAKTEKGWVDVPIANPPKDMEVQWGH